MERLADRQTEILILNQLGTDAEREHALMKNYNYIVHFKEPHWRIDESLKSFYHSENQSNSGGTTQLNTPIRMRDSQNWHSDWPETLTSDYP